MQEEYESPMANGTWKLTKLPKDSKYVRCKWKFWPQDICIRLYC